MLDFAKIRDQLSRIDFTEYDPKTLRKEIEVVTEPKNKSKRWTAQETEELKLYWGMNGSVRQLARHLGRSESSIHARLSTLRKQGCL